jgi:serine/threonine-protein kinase
MGLFEELKRRNVLRMAGLYLVGAWLLVQVATTVLPLFGVADWVLRALIVVLAIGFVPALIFSWVFELTPQGLKRDDDVAPEQSIAPQVARRMDRTIIVVLVVALGYFALDKFVLAPRHEATSVPPESQGTSIAVLPLANDSGDQDQQYFSDGLSEDLITALSQFQGLKVIGRSSSFQFRGSKDDSRTIGAKLGVSHLIEGSVRRAGDTVRISAQLVKAADGSTLWSQRYDRPYKDLFALQDEISQAVSVALKTRLLPSDKAGGLSERPPSGNLEAYDAYLRANFHYARRTEADIRKGLALFEEAARLDPDYAQSWATAARAWISLGLNFLEGEAARDAFARARQAADTALRLAPELPVGHVARGYVLQTVDFDWRGMEAENRRAAELAPGASITTFALGLMTATLGHPEQALTQVETALEGDPLHASWLVWRGTLLASLGRLDEADASIRKAIELQPTAASYHEQLAVVAILRGDASAALAAAEAEPPGKWRDVGIALARQIGPDRAAADAALESLIRRHAGHAAFQIAKAHALRGDPDRALEWLGRAYSQRDPGIPDLSWDPIIQRLRADPRFAAFLEKVGLPAPAGR